MFQDEIKYLHVKIEDSYQENIYRVIERALKFIEDAFDKYYADLSVYNEAKAAAATSAAAAAAAATSCTSSSRHYYQDDDDDDDEDGDYYAYTPTLTNPAAASSRDSSATMSTSFYLPGSSSGGGGSSRTKANMLAAAGTRTTTTKSANGLVKPKQPVFLIHCNLGISRSSSILIAYLINKYKLCLYAAFNYVKDKRLQIAPNYSFLRQLKQFEEEFY